jgi:TIR domain
VEKLPKKSGETIEVFFSYSHKGERMRDKLEKHLSALRRENVIAGWHDRKIMPGGEWKDQIDEHIETAHIILLLVSAEFLSSDYCYDVELKRAIARHDKGEARVVPVRAFLTNLGEGHLVVFEGFVFHARQERRLYRRPALWTTAHRISRSRGCTPGSVSGARPASHR